MRASHSFFADEGPVRKVQVAAFQILHQEFCNSTIMKPVFTGISSAHHGGSDASKVKLDYKQPNDTIQLE